MGYAGDLRACTYCCRIVLSCLQSIDPSAESSPSDLARIQEDLQKKLAMLLPSFGSGGGGGGSGEISSGPSAATVEQSGDSGKSRANLTLKRKVSVSFQEERFAASGGSSTTTQSANRRTLLHDVAQLKILLEELTHPQNGLILQSHRYKLRSYANCCVGNELVDWLVVRDKTGGSSRLQATALAQALMEAGYLECLSTPGERLFIDGYSLYRPAKCAQPETVNLVYYLLE